MIWNNVKECITYSLFIFINTILSFIQNIYVNIRYIHIQFPFYKYLFLEHYNCEMINKKLQKSASWYPSLLDAFVTRSWLLIVLLIEEVNSSSPFLFLDMMGQTRNLVFSVFLIGQLAMQSSNILYCSLHFLLSFSFLNFHTYFHHQRQNYV